ncbi:hypothetical protein KM043_003573 [Ampulex compressa]|nr:hypothetical protein KM043_003573 [Ampulex compressa]
MARKKIASQFAGRLPGASLWEMADAAGWKFEPGLGLEESTWVWLLGVEVNNSPSSLLVRPGATLGLRQREGFFVPPPLEENSVPEARPDETRGEQRYSRRNNANGSGDHNGEGP